MRRKLRLLGRSGLTIDGWSRDNYPLPAIPEYVYGRHLRRRAKYHYKDRTAIVDIGTGWYVHCYQNGIKMLSALPF